ncbi:MAG: hypothetical protein WBH03_10730, partial [Cyclobacteriaceae bacterium]
VGHLIGWGHSHKFLGSSQKWHQEYGDPWDIMSAASVHTFAGAFGPAGPGLNSVNLWNRGALDSSQVWTPAQGPGSVSLFALHPLDSPQLRVIRVPSVSHLVPFKDGDGGQTGWPLHSVQGYLTAEFRSSRGWDLGLASTADADDAVLVRWGTTDTASPWFSRSVLLTPSPLRQGDRYVDPTTNLQIAVLDIQPGTSATVDVGPAASIDVEVATTEVSRDVVHTGDFDWPGIDGHCPPMTFPAEAWRSQVEVDVSVVAFQLESPVTLSMSVENVPIDAPTTGSVAVPTVVTSPDLTSGQVGNDLQSTATVVLDYAHTNDGVRLRNHPGDGAYAVELTIVATDAKGVAVSRNTSITVRAAGWSFGGGFEDVAHDCLMSAIGEHRKAIAATVPAGRMGHRPDPRTAVMGRHGPELYVQPSENRWLTIDAEGVRRVEKTMHTLETLASQALKTPPIVDRTSTLGMPWSRMGWSSDRVRFRRPSPRR